MSRPNFQFVQELMGSIAERMRASVGNSLNSELSKLEQLTQSCTKLMSKAGEASQVAIATEALEVYTKLTAEDRAEFFRMLLNEFGADPIVVRQTYDAWNASPSEEALVTLFNATEPKRQTLLRRLNLSSGGTSVLVQMRADLLDATRTNPELKPVDADFSHLFSSWFNRGFLVIRRIDWNTSANILDKIVEYEAVHEIRDWDDLRRRLDPKDRRCYGFFHPSTGDEPLIFIEVALSKGVAKEIGPLLSVDTDQREDSFDTAVFYSISNCQKGLKGISFGNFLIKQVVQELHRELPDLNRFVTLSPMPGFAKWLSSAAEEDPEKSELLEYLQGADWQENDNTSQAFEPQVKRLLVEYLKTWSLKSNGPIDPVARFHLGNGACAFSLNWPADLSQNGQQSSFGAMINYLYELDKIEERHERYAEFGEIALSDELQRELKTIKVEAA